MLQTKTLEEMLRHEAHEGHVHGIKVTAPAQKLALLVSMGIPVGICCALISFSKSASHRIYLTAAGLVGCLGILGAALHAENPPVLMAAMLVTHMPPAQDPRCSDV